MKQKLKSSRGFTMVEMLLAVLILLLVSGGMASGVRMAQRQFQKSIRVSEAQQLFATIETILTNELKYTGNVTLGPDSGGGERPVITFFSHTYAIREAETSLEALDKEGSVIRDGGYGELALGTEGDENSQQNWNRILGSASYSSGIGAKVEHFTYNESNRTFTLHLTLAADNEVLVSKQFQINALNKIKISNSGD